MMFRIRDQGSRSEIDVNLWVDIILRTNVEDPVDKYSVLDRISVSVFIVGARAVPFQTGFYYFH